MVNAYVKIEKEERASRLAEEELDLLAEDGRSEQMQTFLRDFPELKPPVTYHVCLHANFIRPFVISVRSNYCTCMGKCTACKRDLVVLS